MPPAIELVIVAMWSLAAITYIIVRERRWRLERRVLGDVTNGTRAQLEKMLGTMNGVRTELETTTETLSGTRTDLEQMHERCVRIEQRMTRVLCAVHKFQHANPKLADAIDAAMGDEGN